MVLGGVQHSLKITLETLGHSLRKKSQTSSIFHSFHTMISNQFQSSSKALKTDNDRDYFN